MQHSPACVPEVHVASPSADSRRTRPRRDRDSRLPRLPRRPRPDAPASANPGAERGAPPRVQWRVVSEAQDPRACLTNDARIHGLVPSSCPDGYGRDDGMPPCCSGSPVDRAAGSIVGAFGALTVTFGRCTGGTVRRLGTVLRGVLGRAEAVRLGGFRVRRRWARLAELRRSRGPCFEVLENIGIEGVGGAEHGVDERPATAAALGAHRGGRVPGGTTGSPWRGPSTSTAGLSRTAARSSAALEPRPCALKVSTRTESGAVLSCRTSQFTRVVGRPSRGASTSTWQVTFDGSQVRGDDELTHGVGDADGAGELTGLAQHRGERLRAQSRVGLLLAGQNRDDLGAELPAQAEAGEPEQGVEPGNHVGDALVGRPQSAGSHRVPNGYPALAHVLELQAPERLCSR